MQYKTISESTVRNVAELAGPDSNFHQALQWAEEYRQAGLSPVYYTDDDERILYVTTEERMSGTKFN